MLALARKVWCLCGLLIFASSAMAVEWHGHLTTLDDAQLSCTDMLSLECQPFLAEAVAVAEVFSEIAKPDEKGDDFIVTFRDSPRKMFTKLAGIHERTKLTSFDTRSPTRHPES